jgi:hypothetical protein
MNDDGLAFFQTEGVVNALQRRQTRDGDRAGMPQIQSLGDRRGLVGGHRDIFCVEAALWILPVVGIDFIADSQPPHPRADRRDDARTVEAENHRKVRFAGGTISLPDVGVPSANACGIDRDQDFAVVHRRDVITCR